VVANLQSVAMLGIAFAQGRDDLLPIAMRDRIHQPFRSEICPLLPRLLPLAGSNGILGAALSGAGPAVLIVVRDQGSLAEASETICKALKDLPAPELVECRFLPDGARQLLETHSAGQM
jgi:homoserine kinase